MHRKRTRNRNPKNKGSRSKSLILKIRRKRRSWLRNIFQYKFQRLVKLFLQNAAGNCNGFVSSFVLRPCWPFMPDSGAGRGPESVPRHLQALLSSSSSSLLHYWLFSYVCVLVLVCMSCPFVLPFRRISAIFCPASYQSLRSGVRVSVCVCVIPTVVYHSFWINTKWRWSSGSFSYSIPNVVNLI